MRVDLNAKRAARAEARNEPHVVEFGDRDYELVYELPIEFAELLNAGRFKMAVGLILADPEDLAEFMSNSPTFEDIKEIAEVFGLDGLGESSASASSSNNTSSRSRPTSNRSTALTSAKRAGARKAG